MTWEMEEQGEGNKAEADTEINCTKQDLITISLAARFTTTHRQQLAEIIAH